MAGQFKINTAKNAESASFYDGGGSNFHGPGDFCPPLSLGDPDWGVAGLSGEGAVDSSGGEGARSSTKLFLPRLHLVRPKLRGGEAANISSANRR